MIYRALWVVAAVIGSGSPSFAQSASGVPRVKLQWIDAAGGAIDLDWPTRTRWIWKQVADTSIDQSNGEHSGAFAQISIELPAQLNVELPPKSRARLLEGGAQNEDAVHSTLILETQNPSLTEKLILGGSRDDDLTANSQVGLAATLVSDTPKIILHPSCLKEGLRVERIRGEGSFLFLAAHCRRDAKFLAVTFQTSQDAEFVDVNGKTLSKDFKIECLLPKVGESGPFSGELRVENQLSPQTALYRVSWTGVPAQAWIGSEKGNGLTTASLRNDRTGNFSLLPEGAFRNWSGEIGTGLGLLFYAGGDAELTWDFWLRAVRPIDDRGTKIAAEFSLPFLPITRHLFQPLASGFYEFTGGLRLPEQNHGEWKFTLQPGLRFMGVNLVRRDDAPGFLFGPDLQTRFYIPDLSGSAARDLEKWPWVGHLRVSLFGGSGMSPAIHSYVLAALVSRSMAHQLLGMDLSLTAGLEYIKLNRLNDRTIDGAKLSGGAQFSF